MCTTFFPDQGKKDYKTKRYQYVLGEHGTLRQLTIKPAEKDHIILKRRDSAFQDTELRVWLQSIRVNTLIFCGIDTSICVESSLRDAFNLGYDVILVSDATASGISKHYETTIERIRDYYGIAIDCSHLRKMIKTLEQINDGETKYDNEANGRIMAFLEKHDLIDVQKEKRTQI